MSNAISFVYIADNDVADLQLKEITYGPSRMRILYNILMQIKQLTNKFWCVDKHMYAVTELAPPHTETRF